ncbi:hypothetical protein [Streptomyces rimosus]|uniref:hypothetical protein n=1 Tax=Streptomyces rimosus TaxID=1927 RepID=UPI00067B0306|nr:hypothetical protein [Streptomyces rimosus]
MNATETVHQIVFRWDADHAVGGAGVGPVAWSGNRDGLEPIYRRIAPLLRVPDETARESLARVELPAEAGHEKSVLLIRRIPDRDRGGRPSTCSHALLGSASVLTPGRCLGLHDWRWEGSGVNLREVEGRTLDCVPARTLWTAADRTAPALTERTGRFPEELTAVLAERLRRPRRRLSVLDRTGGEGPVPVLWGLRQLVGPALPDSWSFATHDTRDGGPFRYVFVPRWPVSATQDQQLTRLDPARAGRATSGGDGPDDGPPDHGGQARDAAERLVDHYLEHRYDPEALRETRRALAERRVFEQERLDERVRLVHEALKWLSHAVDHRRSRTDRADGPAREAAYDDRVFDHLRQDQEQRPYRRGHGGQDRPAYDPQAYDRAQPYDRAREDRAQPYDPPDTPYEERGGQSHDPRQAVRAGTGFPRDVTAEVLRRALHQNGDDAARYLHNSTDEVLLEVLEGALPAAQADRAARVLADRAPHRTVHDARAVCERLLLAHLFLGPGGGYRDEDPVTGPDGRMRVRTAVLLYDELVRPYAEQGSAPGLLPRVLAELWHGHGGRGRAVLRQLLDDGRPTGFGDKGWKALFDTATRTTAPQETAPAPRPAARGFRLPGRRSRDTRPPDDPYGREDDTAGRLWVTALLMLIAVAVILIAVIALAGS